MKKALSVFLAGLLLVLSFSTGVFAEENEDVYLQESISLESTSADSQNVTELIEEEEPEENKTVLSDVPGENETVLSEVPDENETVLSDVPDSAAVPETGEGTGDSEDIELTEVSGSSGSGENEAEIEETQTTDEQTDEETVQEENTGAAATEALKDNGIPVINICLNGVTIEEINAGSKETKYEGNTVYIRSSGELTQYDEVQIKGRGNASWLRAKKPYQIKFDKKTDLFGLGKAKKWVLLANYDDKSLMRNDIAQFLAEKAGIASPLIGTFVDLYADGEYLGNYYLCHKVEIGSSTLDISDDKAVIVESDLEERAVQEDVYAVSSWSQYIVLKDSTADEGSEEQAEAFDSFMTAYNKLEKDIDSGDWSKICKDADIDSFVRYFMVMESTLNYDYRNSSFFFYKDGDSDLIHCGPCWDFDIGFGNFAGASNYSCVTYYVDGNQMFQKLTKFSQFQSLCKEFYKSTMRSALVKAKTRVSENKALLKASGADENELWGGSFESAADSLALWISNRVDYMDNTYGGESISADFSIKGIYIPATSGSKFMAGADVEAEGSVEYLWLIRTAGTDDWKIVKNWTKDDNWLKRSSIATGSYDISVCVKNHLGEEKQFTTSFTWTRDNYLKVVNGITYVYKGDGTMYKNATPVVNGAKYCCSADGSLRSGWVHLGKWKMYFDPETYKAAIYFNEIDGKMYLFNKDGVMQDYAGTTVVDVNGKKGKYWFSTDDASLRTGWLTLGEWKLYFDPDTYAAYTDTVKMIDGKWYAFSSSGAVIKNATPVINGHKYYCSGNGTLRSGWLRLGKWKMYFDPQTYRAVTYFNTIDGKTYLFNKDGVMQNYAGTTNVEVNGVTNKYWFSTDDASLKTGWLNLGTWKLYFDPETYVAYVSTTAVIDGVTYVFDKNGAAKAV